ncbi:hypothetical protein COT54_02510 [Candidatus Collierbacteria bacterium CG09_land_8_20_14_0_10_46_12]|uniref:Type II secretion system protein GspG C-terminal domain-containing protein n=2 Tax=Candidatus Collieribacteriota TaxID=1752725 RepID=A0A2H0WYU5_9BACT|nr:MAG: hypothetical protein COT54_02510 [Candidatus Collierbacteria bacterium CG09_land_8_20_14_0_10_46_12]
MKKGFTLIELLVVITIIATLIGVASVSYSRATKSARDARRKTDLEQIRQALESYRSQSATGVYPPSATWKTALQNGYITTVPTDPKENGSTFTYTYTPGSPATTYGLCANLEILTPTPHCVYQP